MPLQPFYAVDPLNIPAKLEGPQLEYFILFGILVAGKGAKVTEQKLNGFLLDAHEYFRMLGVPHADVDTPFKLLRRLAVERHLTTQIEKHRLGQYKRVEAAFRDVQKIDVSTLHGDIGLNLLESVPGIGPKTARMVMLYAEPGFQGVPLDTHILKYLASRGYRTPKSTPPAGGVYRWLEAKFQIEAVNRGLTVRELDTLVWKAYNSGQFDTLKALEDQCPESTA